MARDDLVDVRRTVVVMHSGRLCRLSCDPYYKVFAQLSGRIRRFRINKVVSGGLVGVGGEPYDPTREIFTFRAR